VKTKMLILGEVLCSLPHRTELDPHLP